MLATPKRHFGALSLLGVFLSGLMAGFSLGHHFARVDFDNQLSALDKKIVGVERDADAVLLQAQRLAHICDSAALPMVMSSSAPPVSPITGQLWCDEAQARREGKMVGCYPKFWDGQKWQLATPEKF